MWVKILVPVTWMGDGSTAVDAPEWLAPREVIDDLAQLGCESTVTNPLLILWKNGRRRRRVALHWKAWACPTRPDRCPRRSGTSPVSMLCYD